MLQNNFEVLRKICRVKGTYCVTPRPECVDPQLSHYIEVRAVNIAKFNEIDRNLLRRKRRHSNAEINSDVYGNIIPVFEHFITTESPSRHFRHGRNERENIFHINKFKSTDKENVGMSSSQQLYCIADRINESAFKDSNQLFYSNWKKGKEFICGAPAIKEMSLIASMFILLLLAISSSIYWARKKYNKMKNIGVVMPEGLADHIPSCKSFDNVIEKNVAVARSDELYYHKEDHHLLAAICNDSMYKSRTNDELASAIDNECNDASSSEHSSQSTETVELNDMNSSGDSSITNNANEGGVRNKKPLENCSTGQIEMVSVGPGLANLSLPATARCDNASGYVLAQSLQKVR